MREKVNKGKYVILLGGKMYSGKSTAAAGIAQGSEFRWAITPLAGWIKKLINLYHGVTPEEALLRKEEIRPDYQKFGTEVVRDGFATDFWVRTCMNQNGKLKIIDDCRYGDEMATIREMSAKLITIWIDADDSVRQRRCEAQGRQWMPESSSHASEKGFTGEEDFWDYRLENNLDSVFPLLQVLDPIIDLIDRDVDDLNIRKSAFR